MNALNLMFSGFASPFLFHVNAGEEELLFSLFSLGAEEAKCPGTLITFSPGRKFFDDFGASCLRKRQILHTAAAAAGIFP